ncbi:terminase [Escherichia coli]|nr:terminase [Escherichia coli]EJI0834660.1 terminase small subunit [Escherichia coli]
MEVNKKQLAEIFGASIRTIQNWQEQGMPVLRGGGKGNEVLYDSAAVIKWYAERDAEIENEKLRREVEELRQASETDLQPGTIEYERHRLTRAQADAQELKNARDSAEVVETAFCTFVLSRIAGEIASILDGIPLSVQRRFPELENRHVDFLKRDIIKAMNKAAALDELITAQLHETLPDGAVIHIVPRVAGAKSGGVFQIVLGAAAIAGSFFTAGATLAAWGAAIGTGGMTGILFSLGASMVLGGVAQMLAPKARTPRTQTTDNGKQNTYFSSLDNMVAQGNVLPVLYGEMRVGSRVVSQEISTADEGDGGQVVVIGR